MPNKELWKLFAKAAFFFMVGVIFATLFIWSLVEGFLIHTGGDISTALLYYFAAWLSGIGALALYVQAKTIFRYAKLSQ